MTFQYPIPTHVVLKKGGNIMSLPILLSNDVNSVQYKITSREGNLLNIESAGGQINKTHIDMCWVLLDIPL